MNKKKNPDAFDQIIYKRGMRPNIISAGIIFIYSVSFVFITLKQLPWAMLLVAGIVVIAEFVISPLTNGILTGEITKLIENWKSGELKTEQERTQLFLALSHFPFRKAVQTHIYYLVCAIFLAMGYSMLKPLAIAPELTIASFSACLFGAYTAGIITLSYSEEICSTFCTKLIKEGIDKQLIEKKKSFGLNLGLRCFIYLIMPLFYIIPITYFMAKQYFYPESLNVSSQNYVLFRNIIVIFVNTSLYLELSSLFRKKLTSYANQMSDRLEEIIKKQNENIYIDTNLFDSLNYSTYLVNETASAFMDMLESVTSVSTDIMKTSNNLAAISKELEYTSQEQNVRLTEANSTVKEMNSAIRNIKSKTENVAAGCNDMNTYLTTSSKTVQQNMEQIQRIDSSNKKIIECINTLTSQTENIDNVMKIIKDIASQTRIIAFNAELEAVGAGKAGKNYHIVSSEIQRLADNIVKSIKEIQTHIKDIKGASRSLIDSSENTTNSIQEEMEHSHELEKQFMNIKNSAEKTSFKANEIKSIIEKQSESFNEMVITIDQINESIENFTKSTTEISAAANQIQSASNELELFDETNETKEKLM